MVLYSCDIHMVAYPHMLAPRPSQVVPRAASLESVVLQVIRRPPGSGMSGAVVFEKVDPLI